MFESLSIPEARPIVWLKRSFIVVIVALLTIGATSSYRAYVQVQSLELSAPSLMSVGSEVKASVVSSGRTFVDVQVELIQGSHSEVLFVMRVPGNELGFFDPRSQRAARTEVVSADVLSGFQRGHARIRAVATGRPQWMRLPPPTVREVEVQIP